MNQLRNAAPDGRAATTEPLPGSRKIYIHGNNGIRVPMREIRLHPTKGQDDQTHGNPPIRVYDTSGPYTDRDVTIDLQRGLPEMRKPWILQRGESDKVEPSYRPIPGQSDPDTPLPARREILRGRDNVTQMH